MWKEKICRCKIDGARVKYRSHRTRKLYQHVKNLKGDYKNVLYDDCILIDNYGWRIGQKLGKLFEKFLSCKQWVEVFPPSRNIRNNQLYLSPYLKEISCQLQKLKNHKSSGKEEIVAELLKIEGGELTQRIWKIITKVWETEKISHPWFCVMINFKDRCFTLRL
jgi:hypothetical protein